MPKCDSSLFYFIYFWFGGHTWQCLGVTPGRLRGPYGMSGIEPRSAAYKVNVLPTVLSLWSHILFLVLEKPLEFLKVLALCWGITPGRAQGDICGAGNWIQVCSMQNKCLTHYTILQVALRVLLRQTPIRKFKVKEYELFGFAYFVCFWATLNS